LKAKIVILEALYCVDVVGGVFHPGSAATGISQSEIRRAIARACEHDGLPETAALTEILRYHLVGDLATIVASASPSGNPVLWPPRRLKRSDDADH
jgi:hypothetical protein